MLAEPERLVAGDPLGQQVGEESLPCLQRTLRQVVPVAIEHVKHEVDVMLESSPSE